MENKQEWVFPGAAPRGRQRRAPVITVILLSLAVFMAACTSLSPVSDDAKTLQEQIRTGEAVHQGDRVRVVTHDGVSRRLIVVSVEGDVLKGRPDSALPAGNWTDEPDAQVPDRGTGPTLEIPIADIVLVEKENISTGKTAALTGGVLLVFLALSAAAAIAAVAA